MRNVLFSALLAMTCLSVLGQEPADGKKKKKTEDGLHFYLGPTFATITGEDSYDWPLVGLQAGIGVKIVDFNNTIGLWGGVNGSMQGGKFSDNYTDDNNQFDIEGKLRTTYINIPVVARYANPGGFFAEAGIQPGFLIKAKEKFESGDNEQEFDVKDNMEKFDLGIPVGLGFKARNGFGLGVHAIPGISKIFKSNSDEYKNRNLVIVLRASLTL